MCIAGGSEASAACLLRFDLGGVALLIGASALPYYRVEYKCRPGLDAAASIATAAATVLLAAVASAAPSAGPPFRILTLIGSKTPRGEGRYRFCTERGWKYCAKISRASCPSSAV